MQIKTWDWSEKIVKYNIGNYNPEKNSPTIKAQINKNRPIQGFDQEVSHVRLSNHGTGQGKVTESWSGGLSLTTEHWSAGPPPTGEQMSVGYPQDQELGMNPE